MTVPPKFYKVVLNVLNYRFADTRESTVQILTEKLVKFGTGLLWHILVFDRYEAAATSVTLNMLTSLILSLILKLFDYILGVHICIQPYWFTPFLATDIHFQKLKCRQFITLRHM